MGEFELIRHYFQQHSAESTPASVLLGVGDDAALLQPPAGEVLAVSVDTLVNGVHFPDGAPAEEIAQRALRVNLSDLAAMGARPLWFTLALTLPEASDDWLRDFSRGLFDVAETYGITLVGGDTTKGPLTITLQVIGSVPPGLALRRDGASAGDYVLVTHTLGDSAAGLACLQGRLEKPVSEEVSTYLQGRYWRPNPRLDAAMQLLGVASAALDISDGLVADLGHICAASDLSAELFVEELPLSPALQSAASQAQGWQWALTGGDDYELCFTVPESRMPEVGALIGTGALQATVVGRLGTGSGVHCTLHGAPYDLPQSGYSHF
ncbi:thiamine-phosphate kinase [Marinimicrobium sp. C6131]|uniref:thiamine-phosphate kinase n=1 Tax=Marinimicrobium sp. C6131 TaxID=3022676 RepID=UPI00223DA8F6|nr:thiamine-phosphate kinase [Marinimicrobium sp. C6131]UZJ44506.1 thiamine-phosphate kinase [Marinimicrobium sp. C6131]